MDMTEADAIQALLSVDDVTTWRSINDIMDEVTNTRFDLARKCHDWRNHVPEAVQKVWELLPVSGRLAVFWTAENKAHGEDWE